MNINENKLTVLNTADLPSSDEYRESIGVPLIMEQYSEPKYKCPKCNGGMCRDNSMILTSMPPQYKYVCNKCGNVEYQYG